MEAEVLSWGSDREPPPARRRGRRALAAAVAVALALGLAAAGLVRGMSADPPPTLEAWRSVVAVTGDSTRGTLELDVAVADSASARLTAVELQLDGVRVLRTLPESALLRPGRPATVRVEFAVPDCAALARAGTLRLRAGETGGSQRAAELAVGGEPADEGLPADAVAVGCRPTQSDRALAVTARTVDGHAAAAGHGAADVHGAQGRLTVEVTNLGAPAVLVAATAELAQVLFLPHTPSTAGRPLATGESVRVPVDFFALQCPPTLGEGRLAVTVEVPDGGLRQLLFPLGEEGGSRDVRAACAPRR